MPTVFPATDTVVRQFRRLMLVVLCSGVLAGLALFTIQQFTVIPLIQAAETYETAEHEDEGWRPANGWQRTSLTALTTVLSSMGFAAILFGSVAFSGKTLTARHGALWGLAAFACFDLAPALGLPPQPPGVALADVSERQLWWVGTAIGTAVGLWLLLSPGRNWLFRIGGIICLSMPHWIGAPIAHGQNSVPAQLINQFTIASVATSGVFWVLLGMIGGLIHVYLYGRDESSS
jgi:cobalt transporter subunit CbtA